MRISTTLGASLVLSALVCAAGTIRAQETQNWLAAADPSDAPASLSSAPAWPPGSAPWPPGLLMEGLGAVGAREAMDSFGLRMYGFVESGFTGRLTGGQEMLPGRLIDARRPNDLRLNQLWLTLERLYDKNKTFDVGGRVDAIYGGDAMLTHALGLNQLGDGSGENWFDPFQFYGQLWLRTAKNAGLELQVGRITSPTGFETTDAARNPLYSHGYLFDFAGPFTITGAIAKYYFNDEWSSYFGVVNGWDDFEDNNRAHSYVAGAAWASRELVQGRPSSSLLLNFMTGPEQPGNVSNYRTLLDFVATHWWTRRLSQAIEADYVTEENVPPTGRRESFYGLAHYLAYVFDDHYTGVWRAEWARDSGFAKLVGSPGTLHSFANLYEMTWGVTITPWPNDHVLQNLTFQPEFRWDFADAPVFGGGRDYQLTVGMNVVFRF